MSSTDGSSLFVFTASDPSAQEHVKSSVANDIDPALCRAHFDTALLDEVRAKSGDGNFYAWGAIPGPTNTRNWSDLKPGDYVLAYQKGEYTYASRIIAKHRNAAFANAVWGLNPSNQTWELMYFLAHPIKVNVRAGDLADFLPAQYMGFSQISQDRIQKILAEFGSLEEFMNERVINVPSETYLLIRSNLESDYVVYPGRKVKLYDEGRLGAIPMRPGSSVDQLVLAIRQGLGLD